MQKGYKKKKFGRSDSQHRAIMRGLFRSLIIEKQIKTTEAKAKALKVYADKVISKARKEDGFKNKALLKYVSPQTIPALKKAVKKYEKRIGGYSRVVKIDDLKRVDKAAMAIIKLV